MPTRAVSEIHEVILDNPEGGARGIIEYYLVYVQIKHASRHVLTNTWAHNGVIYSNI